MTPKHLLITGITMVCAANYANAAAVAVGSSTLIQNLHFSDTFTTTANGGLADRNTTVYPVPAAGLVVESSHGNPSQSWSTNRWSIDTDASVNDPLGVFVGSGGGSATGMTQTGGGVDYGIEYGLSSHFLVQFDAFQPTDRIDITAGSSRDNISSGLAVFFRTTGNANGEIGIYNPGVTVPLESTTGFTTGIANINEWHNYAVRFNTANDEIEFFVDEVSRGMLDLTLYDGGKYSGLASNAAVSVGGTPTSGNRFWSDNFQIGTPVPEPSGAALIGLAGLALLRRRR